MLLNGYKLEIIVNGQPLEEYTLPIDGSRSTTGPSYTLNEMTQRRDYSDLATYVAVTPESRYSVRFSATGATIRTPLMAYVLVDGEHDYTYRGLSGPLPREKDCFWSNTFSKRYHFKFGASHLSEMDDPKSLVQRESKGGLGAISLYFYKAKVIPPKFVAVPDFAINQAQVTESKSTCDIKLTTAFEEAEGMNDRPVTIMEQQSEEPAAVLHLHYRPVTWLSIRGCNVPAIERPNQLPSPRGSGSSADVKPYTLEEGSRNLSLTGRTKYKVIKAAVVRSSSVIEIADDESETHNRDDNEVIDLENYTPRSNKRTYTKEVEVIELLDSEDEEVKEEHPSKILRFD